MRISKGILVAFVVTTLLLALPAQAAGKTYTFMAEGTPWHSGPRSSLINMSLPAKESFDCVRQLANIIG